MIKLWDKESTFFKVCRAFVNLCTATSFSSFKVEGRDNIPSDGAVIFAPSHRCTLMDALVMIKANGSHTVFGARADVFRKPVIASILRWMHIVPLARYERDGVKAAAGNIGIFEEITESLDHGIPFCIFVEGTHYPDRIIHQVHHGIFRISEMYSSKYGKPVYIVPVGLDYDYFFDYMRGVTVRYGAPIEYGSMPPGDYYQKAELLRDRIQELISGEEPVREYKALFPRIVSAVLLLPVLAVCFALCWHILLLTRFFSRNLKDRAWINTIRYCCGLLFPIHWPFHRGFYMIMNFYHDLKDDL